MMRKKFRGKDWVYLFHKDCDYSIDPNDLHIGDLVYISMYKDMKMDGGDATVGKTEDFQYKLYVEFEEESTTDEIIYGEPDENGFYDSIQGYWARIIGICRDGKMDYDW